MDGPFWVDLRAPHISADIPSVTLAGTAKAIVPVANLPILGSNYFSFVGKAVRLSMFGRITTALTPGNANFGLWWGNGTDANGSSFCSNASFALTASQNNISWNAVFIVRCRAIGASGALFGTGWAQFGPSVVASTLQPLMFPPNTPAQQTLDLTANNVISPQFSRSGSTAESIQVHEFCFEALN